MKLYCELTISDDMTNIHSTHECIIKNAIYESFFITLLPAFHNHPTKNKENPIMAKLRDNPNVFHPCACLTKGEKNSVSLFWLLSSNNLLLKQITHFFTIPNRKHALIMKSTTNALSTFHIKWWDCCQVDKHQKVFFFTFSSFILLKEISLSVRKTKHYKGNLDEELIWWDH